LTEQSALVQLNK